MTEAYTPWMRRIVFAQGEFYHLYNRGVDKRIVFTEADEYERFLTYLYQLNDTRSTRLTDTIHELSRGLASRHSRCEPLVAIGAYCLMPNHFHLYVTPLVENGISKFMQRVQTAYTMYFNQKHERTGALFQGTFKARYVSDDTYAKYLFSYIHLNPAKLKQPEWKKLQGKDWERLRSYLRTYPYSSLREYIEQRYSIIDPNSFPKYLGNARKVDDHIDFWLQPLTRG